MEKQHNFFNKKPLRVYDLARTVIFSDASSCATGAIRENKSGTHTCRKNLTTKERLQSSTWRELLVIEYALTSCSPLLQNTSIHLKTDNFAASVITGKRSNKTSLQEFAENAHKICIENSIKFEVSWIPRNNNTAADAIYLIPRVITYIKRSSCKGVLVLPYWLSVAYWPLIATSIENVKLKPLDKEFPNIYV